MPRAKKAPTLGAITAGRLSRPLSASEAAAWDAYEHDGGALPAQFMQRLYAPDTPPKRPETEATTLKFDRRFIRRSLSDRFHERVQVMPSGCWQWTGALGRSGYGALGSGGRNAPKIPAHRVAYLLYIGPIPEGLDLDHLCRNRGCVNPAHLEAVTRGENLRRGQGRTMQIHRENICAQGHPMNEQTTYLREHGWRRCKICANELRRAKTALVNATRVKPWARQWACCVECGGTDVKHVSSGRCRRCNDKFRRARQHAA